MPEPGEEANAFPFFALEPEGPCSGGEPEYVW